MCVVNNCLSVLVSCLNELAMTPGINTHLSLSLYLTRTDSLGAGLFTLPDPEVTNQVQLNLLILIERHNQLLWARLNGHHSHSAPQEESYQSAVIFHTLDHVITLPLQWTNAKHYKGLNTSHYLMGQSQ